MELFLLRDFLKWYTNILYKAKCINFLQLCLVLTNHSTKLLFNPINRTLHLYSLFVFIKSLKCIRIKLVFPSLNISLRAVILGTHGCDFKENLYIFIRHGLRFIIGEWLPQKKRMVVPPPNRPGPNALILRLFLTSQIF